MRDLELGLAEDDARLLLALGCAWRDIASCSAPGITTSRISTDDTVTPQGSDRFINQLLQLVLDLLAALQELARRRPADDVAQRRCAAHATARA
jgi:hypothetical protein